MRQGPFEIVIIKSNGAAFVEHELGGKHYIAGEPDTEYKVKFIVHSNELGLFPYSHIQVNLYIDGESVGYSRRMNLLHGSMSPSRNTTFEGFRKGDLYQSFVFTTTSPADKNNNQQRNDRRLGLIKIAVNEAVPTNIPITRESFVEGNPGLKEGLQDDKKFWEQPSLHTKRGIVLDTVFQCGKFRWDNVRSTPDATLDINYHTTDMIQFLAEFHDQQQARAFVVPAAPVHVDLSDVVDDPEPVHSPTETVDLTVPEKRVKMEPGSSASKRARHYVGSASSNEVVDLTV